MALYQKSVLKNHINQLDTSKVEKAYKKYVKHFLNPTIQDNIRKSKEEEYQGIFLTDLFVNILDYTLKPNADFNLVAEYKNQNNSRKADGAILSNNNAIAVIELKSTKTKDLESIRKQAFDYKVNQKECIYVVTSNYEKLRFYINDATEFEEFNLFELSKDRFELLYLCLHKDNLLNNVPLQIKEASIVIEEQITNQFYKDYSLFKRELYRDLVKRNAKQLKSNSPVIDENDIEAKTELLQLEKNVKLTLFQKSQKLIDRYLFIFFAEDRGLLPPNSTQQILDKWKADIDFGDERPLYDLFKQYFNFLDTGRKGTTARAEIYAYNGGLFKQDLVLDNLEIDSELLFKHTKKLAAYDFESQVDVNILGHIFENSLNEIESVNAEIQGGEFDKQKSKRKKDGVFYTPKYITKYIVENTIGKLCTEKKNELGFKEDEYFKGRKGRNKSTIENLVSILDIYRDWLLQLTICDPACGSGAFLNQALDFLIKEHNYIDELKTKILGGGFIFPDIETTILENNIYGVDLNEESVEIAKLSLWLRTAQPRRKLNDLSSNIKCGNSLIDNKSVAGNKAFNWETQFPKVFAKGGFDVIIGNPPYVRVQNLEKNNIDYFEQNYVSSTGKFDLYVLFNELGVKLLKQSGLMAYIQPHRFIITDFGKGLRLFFKTNQYLKKIISFSDIDIFEGATTYTGIFFIEKKAQKYVLYKEYKNKKAHYIAENLNILDDNDFIKTKYQNLDNWEFKNENELKLLKKLRQHKKLLDISLNISQGVIPGSDKIYYLEVIEELTNSYLVKSEFEGKIFYIEKEITRKITKGNNIKRYAPPTNDYIIIYPYHLVNHEQNILDLDELNKRFPLAYEYLNTYRTFLIELRKKYKTNINEWYGFHRARDMRFLEADKIITSHTSISPSFTLALEANYFNQNVYGIEIKKDISKIQILGILNSKLTDFYMKNTSSMINGGYFLYKSDYISQIPIIIEKDNELIKEVNNSIEHNTIYSKHLNKFQNYLCKLFLLQKPSKKLQNWHELEFGDFIKELNKAIKSNNKELLKAGLYEVPVLTKKDEFEWLDLFEENKQKAQDLQNQINQTDKEIDTMVYQLYNLTDEEIAIVENS
ncbi:Eco57I restriction-modification methylase domain-containing protein [Wenyingzhuangia marina]|uniref:site-specific DNA-methyltransferase (adenine-specific) n=1 Tax=Wenyingzhuangia marina TaxID=1195760 RepID=A0A1M5T4G6_9FLAO|nr:DNA methyltransferase [Wenyingzhuangia marina]GGF65346.1 type II endonuclease-methyltransferasefusion protein [Wenyingzhuangia marina]SHH45651.1 Eco57I restriction-modification methylase [Wenyingzhuangia marina]